MPRHLITSALPYINGVKHLGNLVGSMLPADVYARYLRAAGEEVLFVCATDEHGTPAELAAREAGQDVAEFCAEQHEVQKDLCEQFGLSWDWFGRTSRPQNHVLTNHFGRRLRAEGLCEIRSTEQVYSHADGRFLPDRYVVGTCPNCGYPRARGDQCENCGKQLDPTDLIEPRSAVSGSTDLEVRQSSHVFLRQSALADRIRAWVDTKDTWPAQTRAIAYKWLDEGLQDRGITRDLSWGIPVDPADFPEVEGKVWYVWFDAPIGYLAATREWADAGLGGQDPQQAFDRWWREDLGAHDVEYTEFMGKDNVPFHTLSFPATILGSGEPWKLVDRLKSFNWLTYYGGKFSTTDHRGVFMSDALELLPADYWRWFLTAYGPEHSDAAFTWEQFQGAVNKDLADVLGNFVNRIVKFAESKFDGVVPEAGEPGPLEAKLEADLRAGVAEATAQFEAMEFRKACQALRAVWVLGNEYLQEAAPWTAFKTDANRAAVGVRTGLNLVALFARLAAPVMPFSAEKIAAAVGSTDLTWPGADAPLLDVLPRGQAVAAAGVLFAKIEDAQVAEWSERFGGAEG